MSNVYTRECTVDFRDLDINGHVRNTAYLAYATDTRYAYFAENGMPADELKRRQVGPVTLRDDIRYLKELHSMERIVISFGVTHIDDDRRKMQVFNEIYKEDGSLACRIESLVVWFDMAERKITVPPDDLHELLNRIRIG